MLFPPESKGNPLISAVKLSKAGQQRFLYWCWLRIVAFGGALGRIVNTVKTLPKCWNSSFSSTM